LAVPGRVVKSAVGAAKMAAETARLAAEPAKVAAGRAATRLQRPPTSRNKIIQKILPADFTPRMDTLQEDFNQILGRRKQLVDGSNK
jgi:hypothetical protein